MDRTATVYDAIVIGSGIGGLTAAGLLAGVAGKRVLVLEKHTEPGGLTHVFRRDGAAWDVGLHYVGEVGPGSRARALFDFLSGGELKWNRMTDAFERFVYPGVDFAVPSDPAQYERKLIETFPAEARAIRRYFHDVRRVVKWTLLGFARGMVPRPIAAVLDAVQRLTARTATMTTKAYLDAKIRSPELRALLATQWGDYGLPPSQSAFAIHAQIVSHYLHGAWYPEGGAGRIARTFEKGIERAGGSILVCQEATEILLEGDRAVGVKVVDRRGTAPVERIYRAAVVVSNAGASATFRRLLPTGGDIGRVTAEIRELVGRLEARLSAVTLYLRLKADARTIGIRGENFWINTDLEHDAIAIRSKDLMNGAPHSVYVSFPSIKGGDERFHTAEIIAFVDDGAFDRWRGRPKGNRGADYSASKQRIGAGLLRLAETAIPGLSNLVAYSELSTPLTVEHYTSHPRGHFYGLPATPERYRSSLLGPRTPIRNLYLSGQDAGCLGILGAMMGGVGAACQALGARGYPMIQAALRRGLGASADPASLPGQKRRAVLTAKTRLTPDIWQVEFSIDADVDDFAPGQFARLHVGGGEWRDYSIAGMDGRTVRFVVGTRTGGQGSRFIEGAAVGTGTEIELPLGHFTLAPNGHRKVFVATGTGLAPFLPMFRELERQGRLREATLLFGCKTRAEDITVGPEPMPGTTVRCVSRERAESPYHQGRVTGALADLDFSPAETEFYLCGSSAMVADCRSLLEGRGAEHLFTESF